MAVRPFTPRDHTLLALAQASPPYLEIAVEPPGDREIDGKQRESKGQHPVAQHR